MMNTNKKTPKLRFKGFTDDWEQREFSDIFAEVKSGLSRMLSNDDIGLPVVRANNINDGQLNLVDDIKYWYKNDPQGANTNNYLIEQGDILINFINSEAKMGTAAYVTRRPERDTIYTTNILRCKVNDEYNPYFIYSLTFLNSYKNYIASITKPAVNQASFTTVDFKKYSIKIPTVKEQNQIADLIKTFNKLITLHQRKLEKLKLNKGALLQKLFPQKGCTIPDVRFKGFTDAWEQRKLGDLLILLKDGSHGTHKNTDAGVYLLSAKNIKNGRINIMPDDRIISWDDYNVIHKNYELQIGDILLTIVGSIGETAIFNLKTKVTFQRSVAFLRPNSNLNNGFLYTLINTDRFQNQLQTKQVVSAQPGIYLGDLATIDITYPKNILEQEKIYNIFREIENSITLHQHKLDRLISIKKGLLQQLFV